MISTTALPGVIAVVLVSVATLAIGTWGLRISRTTSDFFVASRSVGPGLNASAIGGEYLSAASFLGVAGLLLTFGADMLWYPVGWTAGYLVLLVLVAAPLRRSGAYTLPDFAEARLSSRRVRNVCSLLVVAVGWLYLLPQFEGAGITLAAAIDAPRWVGPLVVGVVVLISVGSGGMRSITFVQAFQYWLKLTAMLVPAAVLLVVWAGDRAQGPGATRDGWSMPLADGGGQGLYTTYSLIIATFLGTMGLPHVVVRFYTNPDGRAARRTTLVVLGLLGVFYVIPPVYAALGRAYGASTAGGAADTLVLDLPRLILPGLAGDVLTGLVTAGAFAAFLSTSSGLTIAVSGVLTQDLTGRRLPEVTAFRVATVIAVAVPCRRDPGPARHRGGPHGRPGLRRRRLHLLSPAGPRHLVARADRRRGGGRPAGRRRRVGRRRRLDPRTHAGRLRGAQLGRRAPHPAGRLVGAAGLRLDGARLAAHRPPGAGAHAPLHGAAAHARGGRARPVLTVRRAGPTARRTGPPAGRRVRAHPCRRDRDHFYRDRDHPRPAGSGTREAATPMSNDTSPHEQAARHDPVYDRLATEPDFLELRRRYRGFVIPATAVFLAWFLLFVVMSVFAAGFMDHRLVGNINVALVFGLLQFVTTFLIAYLYSRFSNTQLDPLATSLNEDYEAYLTEKKGR